MKKHLLFVLFLSLSVSIFAQKANQTYLDYIDEWKDVAIQQQIDYGIPASITMAQALLESGAGQSELAKNANNHFGIKCTSDWFGGVYYKKDDRMHDCFREYADAAESYKDHSTFLQRTRYASCFEVPVTDYEEWAHRLRECGYATDPQYAAKLIKIIEDYQLHKLTEGQPVGTPDIKDPQRRPLKAAVTRATEPIMVIDNDPEPPYIVPATAREERDSFLLAHPKKRCNGVAYVVAKEGDTYANVAFRLDVRERELRENNDALGRDLAVGDRIYLAAKKTTGPSDKPYVWTYTGQSLWKLSQEEGVQIEAIQKYNELDPAIRTFRTRQKIYLRKMKDEGVH